MIYRISDLPWGGIGIKHDPTFVAYYVPNLLTVSTPVPGYPMIIFYLAVGAAVVAVTTAVLVVKRIRKGRT